MNGLLTREEVLHLLRKEIPSLRDRFGVEKIAFYGSYAKNTQVEGSDIDLLVELSRPVGLGFVRLASHLEETLGRQVDLATFESLQRSASDPRRQRLARDIERTLIYV